MISEEYAYAQSVDYASKKLGMVWAGNTSKSVMKDQQWKGQAVWLVRFAHGTRILGFYVDPNTGAVVGHHVFSK